MIVFVLGIRDSWLSLIHSESHPAQHPEWHLLLNRQTMRHLIRSLAQPIFIYFLADILIVLFVVDRGVPPNGLAPVTHIYLELSDGKEVEYVRALESVVMYTEV